MFITLFVGLDIFHVTMMDPLNECTCALADCAAYEDVLGLAPCPPPGFYSEFASYALGEALCPSEICKIAKRCMTTFQTDVSSQIIQSICNPATSTTTTTSTNFTVTPTNFTETSYTSITTPTNLTTTVDLLTSRSTIAPVIASDWVPFLIGTLIAVVAVIIIVVVIVVIKRRCTARLYQVASLRCFGTICLCIDENGDRTGIVSDEDHGHYIAHFETKTENVRFSARTGECFTTDEVHESVLKQNTKKLSVHFADKAELVYTSTKHVSDITFKREIQENLETGKSHSSLTQTEPLYEDKLKGNVRLSDGDDDDDDDNEEREEKEGDDDDDDDDDGDEEDYDDDDDDEDDDDDDGDDDDEYEEEDDNGDYYYNYHDDHDNDKDNNDDDGRDDVVVDCDDDD
ncbi:anti-sigma-I factor RsgI-like isoform X1 [Mercenaria mercenaria]|uniref:anti-sigma-I factor RsgI-like isoform X1 n=1 Tax=Mercenaria mercenaria TaxID=6596 RepID=UPI00234F178A|nr:anti-sigma-I factor RsgI-like isoform X1 [Mercenaria mercenaria]